MLFWLFFLPPAVTPSAERKLGEDYYCRFNLFFCMDESGSMSNSSFREQVEFIQEYYEAATRQSRDFLYASAVTFSTEPIVRFKLGDYDDYYHTHKAIGRIERGHMGQTYIGKCMEVARDAPKPNALKNVLLVVTDGKATSWEEPNTDEMSKLMREEGYFIQAAGFGNVDMATLETISGSEGDVILGNDVQAIKDSIGELTNAICVKIMDCVEPPSVEHATNESTSRCSNKYAGYECKIQCESKYGKKGDNPICTVNGYWDSLPLCLAACDALKPIPKQNLTAETCFGVGQAEECDLVCVEGYSTFRKGPYCNNVFEWEDVPECLEVLGDVIVPVLLTLLIIMLLGLLAAFLGMLMALPPLTNLAIMELPSQQFNEPTINDPEIRII